MPMAHSISSKVTQYGFRKPAAVPAQNQENELRRAVSSRDLVSPRECNDKEVMQRRASVLAKTKSVPEIVAPTPKGRKISVAVRKRPLNSKEVASRQGDIIAVTGRNALTIAEPKTKVDLTKLIVNHEYIFDEVFDENSTNEEVYDRTVKDLIEFVFEKGSGTCFAFGQTGSGKTHTMMGSPENNLPGLYAMAAEDLFIALSSPKYAHLDLHLEASFFEIYGSDLFDLLNARNRLVVREDAKSNQCIVGLSEFRVMQVSDMLEMMMHGLAARSTGATGANEESSRSHAVLQISVKTNDGKQHGKISFIDLAGSERGADTRNQGRETRMEGAEINKSLLALKECIRALDMASKHLPFRGSKLTQVLKESFVGNSRTVMIANISPNSLACEHSLNSLRYADRVKSLRKSNGGSAAAAAGGAVLQPVCTNVEEDLPPTRTVQRAVEEERRTAAAWAEEPAPPAGVPKKRVRSTRHSIASYAPPAFPPAEEVGREASPPPDFPAAAASPAMFSEEEMADAEEQLSPEGPRDAAGTLAEFRSYVDENMSFFEKEVSLLDVMERDPGDAAAYVGELERILTKKIQLAMGLRARVRAFGGSL